MRSIAFRLLTTTTAGCGISDVPEVDVRDAAVTEPDGAAPEHALDVPTGEAGIMAPAHDLTPAATPALPDAAAPSLTSPLDAVDSSTSSAAASSAVPAPDSWLAKDAGTPGSDVADPSTRCSPRRYEGSFSGANASLLRPETLSGTITLELTRVPGRDQLTVTGRLDGYGLVDALIPDMFEVKGEVRAVLNCATHQLEAGQLLTTDGSTDVVVGTLSGAYSDSPPSLSGTWMTNDLLFALNGGWSAGVQLEDD